MLSLYDDLFTKGADMNVQIDWEKFEQTLPGFVFQDYTKKDIARNGTATDPRKKIKTHISFMGFQNLDSANFIFIPDEPWRRAHKPWTEEAIGQFEALQENLFRDMVDALSKQIGGANPCLFSYHYEGDHRTSFAATWGQDTLAPECRSSL